MAFLAMMLLSTLAGVWARPVSAPMARKAAENYMQLQSGKKVALTDITASTPYRQFYIFAGAEGQGFVLVAADDCVTPIIGYSTTNAFVTKDMPAHVKGWLDDCEAQIGFYAKQSSGQISAGTTSGEGASAQWENLMEGRAPTPLSETSVSPLLGTTWNQSPYYNQSCPYDYDEGGRAVTGCVATAMAQVMKYWNHPAQGYGSHSYSHDTYGLLSANFGNTTYDWTHMPNALTSSSTTTQINAVATLMYQVGVAIEMNYGAYSSGAKSIDYNGLYEASAEGALRQYFKYRSDLHSVALGDYSTAEWRNLLTNELTNGRPIIYSGASSSTDGGHCFVCDGVNNSGLFHFNWGWGGYCDGYYAIGSLNPSTGGTGGNLNGSYNAKNFAIVGIQPNNSFGETTHVTASSSNTTLGSVTGGGYYYGTNSDAVSVTATANNGCRFVGWSDGCKHNPRSFYANGGSYTFSALFERLSGDTMCYCQDCHLLSFGNSSSQTYQWGIKIPATSLDAGKRLTKVALYVQVAGSYTLKIYEGSTSNLVRTQTQTFGTSSTDRWVTIALNNPLTTSGNQPLWITFSSNEPYPATATWYSGNDDSRLTGSSLSPLSYYDFSFMIKAIFAGGGSSADCTVSTFPWEEDFEHFDNQCWTFTPWTISGTDYLNTTWETWSIAQYESESNIFLASYVYGTGGGSVNRWAFTPAIQLSANNNYTLQYDYTLTANSGTTARLKVYVASAPDAAHAVWMDTYTSSSDLSSTGVIDLSSFAGQTVYIGFQDNSTITYNSNDKRHLITIDNLTVTQTPNHHVNIQCTGTGSGRTIRVEHHDNTDLCGQTDNVAMGFVATYRFLPTQGSELRHLYVNNVDRINEVSTYSSSSSSSYSTWSLFPSGDVTLNPVYDLRSIVVNATTMQTSMGSVTGSGTYTYGDHVTLTAIPTAGHKFVGWCKEYMGIQHYISYDNPLVIEAEEDMVLYAMFETETYTINIRPNDAARGIVTGGGDYEYLSPVTATATAYSGYRFVGWSNGASYNPYTFPAIEDIDLEAIFLPETDTATYTLTVRANDPSMGTATGGGRYAVGSSATITATPYNGFRFVQWDDGNTSYTRVVAVICDMTYTAIFDTEVGIEDVATDDYDVYGTTQSIVVSNAEGQEIQVFDLDGRPIAYVPHAEAEQHIDILHKGIYFVVIDHNPARKVMVW